MTPTDVERAYISGMFDGEGSITCSFKKRKIRRLGIDISNTNIEVLNWIAKFYNCSIKPYSRNKKIVKKNKDCYKIKMFGSRSVLKLLYDIKEYSIIKKERIELAIKYLENPNAWEYRRSLFEKIKKLNKRGYIEDQDIIIPDNKPVMKQLRLVS